MEPVGLKNRYGQYKVIKEFLIEWPNRLLVFRRLSCGEVWFVVFDEENGQLLSASMNIEEALHNAKHPARRE